MHGGKLINLSLAVLIVVVLAYAGLGLVVHLNDPRSKTNKLFVLLIISVIIWVTTNYFENELVARSLNVFLLKIENNK